MRAYTYVTIGYTTRRWSIAVQLWAQARTRLDRHQGKESNDRGIRRAHGHVDRRQCRCDGLDRRPRPGDIEITLSERIVDLVEAVYPGPRGLTSPQGPQGLPGVNAVNAVASYLVDHGSETCTGSTCPSAAITKVENDHSRA